MSKSTNIIFYIYDFRQGVTYVNNCNTHTTHMHARARAHARTYTQTGRNEQSNGFRRNLADLPRNHKDLMIGTSVAQCIKTIVSGVKGPVYNFPVTKKN